MSGAPRFSRQGVPAVVQRVLQSGRVWTIQGLGSLLWLALAYASLWIHEARWWQLAGTLALALFLLYLATFLQRTALRVFRRERQSMPGTPKERPASGRQKLRDWLPAAVLVAFLFAILGWLAVLWKSALPDMTLAVASWLSLHLRRPVDPYRMQRRAENLVFIGPWFLLVVVWLPLAASALLGERGPWKSAARAWKSGRYWLATLVCVAVGHLGFWKLADWVPHVNGIPGESASMVVRLVVGYVIALGSWLVILALVEEVIAPPSSPDDTQDFTPAQDG
jgi:amino acid transporter